MNLQNFYFKIFLIVALSFSFSKNIKATHVSGGDFSYTCVGPNQYLITMNLYNDCSSTVTMPTAPIINFTNNCGTANPPNLTLTLQNPGGTEISQLCPANQPLSSCNGGTLPGMKSFTYTGIVTLPSNCEFFMNYNLCCRNCAVNLQTCSGSNGPNFHLQSSINNTSNNCNNSPQFTSQPIPYVCTNQPVIYNFGAIEPDGDSLVFTLMSALQDASTNVTYNAGYTGAVPVPGATITTNTGQLTFTPTQIGFFVFVIRVDEYDNNGNYLGFVTRDIQFVVQNCSNNPININSGAIQNLTGSASSSDPFSIEMCEGDNFTFTAVFTDPDPSNTLSFTSNISSVLSGASITTSPLSTNDSLVLTVSWTSPAGSSGLNNFFTITATDNACPIPSLITVSYDINVIEATLITPTWPQICGNQNSVLNATGGSVFYWFDSNGDTISVDSTFSCNPCASPTVKPLVTTTYIVVSDLSVGCVNTDTVTIEVVSQYDLSVTPVSSLCGDGGPVFLSSATPGLTGVWTGTGITNPNFGVFNPQFANNGLNRIYFTVNLPDGCGGVDSTDINVVVVPNPAILTSGTICSDNGDTTISAQNPGGVWSSSPNTNAINPTTGVFNPSLAATGNNTIIYTISVQGCTDFAQTTITVQPRANATITSNADTICINDPNFQVTVAQLGGLWTASPVPNAINNAGTFRPNNAGIGTHTLTYTIGGACGASSTKIIEVIGTPQINLSPIDPLCLTDNSVVVTASISGGQWSASPFSSSINQSTGSFSPNNAGVGNHTITYSLNFGNCTANPSINITVKPTPAAPSVNIPNSPCEGETFDPITASGQGGNTIVWYSDEDLNNVLDTSNTYTYNAGSNANLYVTQIFNGCESPATLVELMFKPLPNVSFEANPIFGPAPLTVNFTNNSDSSVNTFSWESNNEFFSSNENPENIFTESGVYIVNLIGTDNNGCENIFTDTIIVDLIIPNVFTPNGDGKNDRFFDLSVSGLTLEDFAGKIFNRWGHIVYEWTDNKGWDGRNNNGNNLSEGIYFYVISAKNPNKENFVKEGNITLLR
jgi:large repetitive protein